MALSIPSGPLLIDGLVMRDILAALAMPGIETQRNLRWSADKLRSSAASSAKPITGVLPLVGILEQHQSFWGMIFGGTDLTEWNRELDALVKDSRVNRIVMPVDSPGGTVPLVPETAAAVRAASRIKPVIAAVSPMSASAALWISSQASQVVIQPSGSMGSLGVYSQHVDITEQLKQDGVTVTTFALPAEKTEMSPYVKLTDDAKQFEMDEIRRLYAEFVDEVAAGRRKTPSHVRANFGGGRMLDSRTAQSVGMADAVGTAADVFDPKRTSPSGLFMSAEEVRTRKLVADFKNGRQGNWQAELQKERERLKEWQSTKAKTTATPTRPNCLRTIAGYVAQFGPVAAYNNPIPGPRLMSWHPRAFDDVLRSNREVIFTVNHNFASPICKRSEFKVDLKADERGLRATVRVPDTELGRQLCRNIDAGKATGWSCSWDVAESLPDWILRDGEQVILWRKGALDEVCICIHPQQPAFAPNGPALVSGVC